MESKGQTIAQAGVVVLGLVAGAGIGLLIGWLAGAPGVLPGFVGHIPWYTSRAAGVMAYLLLSATTLLGLAISTRAADGRLSRAVVFALHEHLSWLALGFIGLHAGALLLDHYQPFRPLDLFIPLLAGYRPFAVALGILSAYLAALLTASFYVRGWLGRRAWRAIHYSSFALYALATLHGVLAGSMGEAWMQWVYLVSGAAVGFLTCYRLLLALGTGGRRSAASTRAVRSAGGGSTPKQPAAAP